MYDCKRRSIVIIIKGKTTLTLVLFWSLLRKNINSRPYAITIITKQTRAMREKDTSNFGGNCVYNFYYWKEMRRKC